MVKNKVSTSEIYGTIALFFFIAGALGLTGVILSGLLFGASKGNTICENCDGIVSEVVTNNQTLSPIFNQTLSFQGISGIRTSIDSNGHIIIDNLRDITPYVVGQDNSYEFQTPQEA